MMIPDIDRETMGFLVCVGILVLIVVVFIWARQDGAKKK